MGHVVTPTELKSAESKTKPEEPPSRSRKSISNGLAHPVARGSAGVLLRTGWGECLHGCCSLLPEKYGNIWRRCFEQLLHGDGPLPEHWRIYIAILALYRHEVTWAVHALSAEFIAAGGDRTWLRGLRFAPQKLKSLAPINKILAYRPWLLTKEYIIDLTKGDESWSLSELCQAICILTHFHALASFLHVCLPKAPSVTLSKPSSPSTPTSLPLTPGSSPAKTNVSAVLSSSLPTISTSATEINGVKPLSKESEDASKEEKKECEESKTSVSSRSGSNVPSPIAIPSADDKVQNSTIVGSKREIQASPQPSKQSRNEPTFTRHYTQLKDFSYLCHDLNFTYEDFPHAKESHPLFKIREYNWQDHGYCTIQRLFSEMGTLLDDRFEAVKTLSHPSWVDSEGPIHYRRAVWNYAQSLFGIHHEEYQYSHISELLSKEVQAFIKEAFCAPTPDIKIAKELLHSEDFKKSQLIPVTVLLMEARIQSELLYALRVLIPHQH